MRDDGFLLWGDNDAEVGTSFATAGSSAPFPKRCRLTVDMEDLGADWRMIVDEVREIMLEHNASVRKSKDEHQSIKLVYHLTSSNVQYTNIYHFNVDVAKRNRVSELYVRINQKKFGNVLGRRYQSDPIIKVKSTKP